MPRVARAKSESGIYHAMLRGIDRTQLFYDDSDRIAFLSRLQRCKNECGFQLYAYCLMDNHVHLLINADTCGLSLVIKKIALSYSHWFNNKYDRCGYLFQGRYKSEPIDNDSYFLSVLKYIHNNPVNIGEPANAWTGYDEYIGAAQSSLVDTEFALSLFSTEPAEAISKFVIFMNESKNKGIGDNKERRKIRDLEAAEIIKRIANVKNCLDLIGIEREKRNQIIASLKEEELTIRQISRLTGINRGIIQRVRR
ncbi:MAG: transposase [Clostridiales Family XIII bacterium]|jgi:REP element-mobilizing transposase RayT|nr:transposase [Clostridiales Family XIII bacterium]